MTSFINNYHSVDRESLRLYVNDQLDQFHQQADKLLYGNEYQAFWQGLHDAIATSEDEEERRGMQQAKKDLLSLCTIITSWQHTAVDTAERMDFFVRSKAAEIASGDQDHDYYWAMRIRHDQLVALVRVLGLLLDRLKTWVTLSPHQVMEDPVFQGMTTYSIEEQIYLEAEQVHSERQKVESKMTNGAAV